MARLCQKQSASTPRERSQNKPMTVLREKAMIVDGEEEKF